MGKKNKKDKKKLRKDLPEKAKKDQKAQPLNMVQGAYEYPSIHKEMAELFEEDQVTHQHGGTEPEGD